MALFFTSPTVSVALVKVTSKALDAGDVQTQAVDCRYNALVPAGVSLEDSGSALEPPAKRVCFSDTLATPPTKVGNLDVIPWEPDHPQVVVNGQLDSLTRQSDSDIRDPGPDVEPVGSLFSLAQLDELKALAALVLLGADETPCRSRLEGLGVRATNLLLSTARDVISGLFADSSSAALFKARRINKEKAIAFLMYAAIGADFPDDAEVAGKAGARVHTHLNSKALGKRRAAVVGEAVRLLHEAQQTSEPPTVFARIERDREERLAAIDNDEYIGFLPVLSKVCAKIDAKIDLQAVAPVAIVTRGAGHVDPVDAQLADIDEKYRQEWMKQLESYAARLDKRDAAGIDQLESYQARELVLIESADAAWAEVAKARERDYEEHVACNKERVEKERLQAILAEQARQEEEEESVINGMQRDKIIQLQAELADTRAKLKELSEWRSMRVLEIQRRLMCPKI